MHYITFDLEGDLLALLLLLLLLVHTHTCTHTQTHAHIRRHTENKDMLFFLFFCLFSNDAHFKGSYFSLMY